MRDFRDFKQRGLSGSEDGRGIAIAATTSPGTLIHTALSSPAANEWDEITLWAVNQAATAITLTVEWGGTTSADRIVLEVPAASGVTRHHDRWARPAQRQGSTRLCLCRGCHHSSRFRSALRAITLDKGDVRWHSQVTTYK